MATAKQTTSTPSYTTKSFTLPWLCWQVSSVFSGAELELARNALDDFAQWARKDPVDLFSPQELAGYLQDLAKRDPEKSVALRNLLERWVRLTNGGGGVDNPRIMDGESELLTDVAQRAGVDPELIRRWVEAGAIELHPSEQGAWASLSDELEQFLRHVVRSEPAAPQEPTETPPPLPDWCHVLQGLSDEEIAEFEAIALDRSNFMRSSS